MKIESKYFEAREHIRLHQEFDTYLSSGELDDDIYCKFSSSETIEEFADKHLARGQFGKLDYNLVRLSLEDRSQIVDMQHHIDTYSENLRNIMASEELKDHLEKLIDELEEEDFFDVDDDSIDWEKACFVSLIDRFKELVFKGHRCPQYVAVQGIMKYYRIISRKYDLAAQVSLEKVVEVECHEWKQNVAEIWMDTRYYEEPFHDFVRNPLKKILPRPEACSLATAGAPYVP
uniref:Uncharacterized protein n=1 Tax=Avena sativa TaxID=4498 RepID=A0ACD5Y8Z3_AVESA